MDYVSIRVSTLRGDQKIDFDAYVRINDKMVLYLRKGDNFDGDRLERLKAKKMRKMFIEVKDEAAYRDYLRVNIEMAYDNTSNKDIKTRAEIIQGSQQANTEEVFENPENVASYNSAKDAAGKYVDFLMNNTEAMKSIMGIQNTDQNLAHHGVTVATLAVALAGKLGIKDPKQTQLMTLGALLHDYGHFDSTLNLARPLSTFSKEELTIYREHPSIGAKKVQDKKHFDQTVINIINQHEERINGSGPLGLSEKQQDPLAIIVATANSLDRLMTYEGVAKDEAAKKLMIDHMGLHPLDQMKFLGEILKSM